MVRGVLNPNYHRPNRPYFDSVELKGGGDAVSAARALLQTGECDYAWNLLVVKTRCCSAWNRPGKGRVDFAIGGTAGAAVPEPCRPQHRGGRRARQPQGPRTRCSATPACAQGAGPADGPPGMQEYIFGRSAVGTPNLANSPPRFRSPNMKAEFSIANANAVLEAAGYKRGADGVREKGGRKLRLLFQTSINAPRQKMQTIIKQACQKAGIEVELKGVVSQRVLLQRRRQPRHRRQVLGRPADVRAHPGQPRARHPHEELHLVGDREQGQQMAGAATTCAGAMTSSTRPTAPPSRRWTRLKRVALNIRNERHRLRRRLPGAADVPQEGHRPGQEAGCFHVGLGQRPGHTGGLVPRGLSGTATRPVRPHPTHFGGTKPDAL